MLKNPTRTAITKFASQAGVTAKQKAVLAAKLREPKKSRVATAVVAARVAPKKAQQPLVTVL